MSWVVDINSNFENNKMKNVYISVVIPVYGCSDTLRQLYERLIKTLSTIAETFEIIMVNDAGPDNSWELIQNLASEDSRVKGINFSRNFGQHYAITAGLEQASGDWVVVMDCDLQDRPEEIIKLYEKANEGFDIVFGQRQERQDSFFKRLSSKFFYSVLSYLTNTKQDPAIANYGIYSRRSIRVVLSMQDKLKYFPVMIRWVGFDSAAVKIQHAARSSGKSNYSLSALISLSIDVMLSFSEKPLKLAVKLGFLISTISFLVSFGLLMKALLTDYKLLGWTSTMMSIWFLGGLIIMVLGVVGIYVGKTFNQTKNRPIYVIKDII